VFLEAIEYCNGNVVQAAKELGIGKTTLYKKLREWEIPIKRKITVISYQLSVISYQLSGVQTLVWQDIQILVWQESKL
jgi:predicted DNA-binding transcriptional regulator AlpA